ncbi:hypothetical protein H0H93_009024 [Arthromyces matolae]|nr:hypothetical protein H0H93_009024 [Arthromyces matolae]
MAYPHPPVGWIPPFHGAAPPMPTNFAVNQRQWQMGSWQFNPAYNWQKCPIPQTQWMAAPTWGYYNVPQRQHLPQHVFPANFNPFKKSIRPPSAEYLAMPVASNGLDLHNMVPTSNPVDEHAPHTPWIWNPATLTHDEPPESAARRAAEAATAAAAAANERSRNRASSEPPLSEPATTSHPKPRHATDPSSSGPSSSSASSSSSIRPFQNNSSPLKPTFSPKIVRTPAHYQSHNASVGSFVGRFEQLNTSENASLGRHSSMPAMSFEPEQSSSVSGAQLSDEPMSMLSPLVMSTPLNPPRRSLTRGATHPEIGSRSALDSIRESPDVVEVIASDDRESFRSGRPSHIYASPPKTAPASQETFPRTSTVFRSESYPRPTDRSEFKDSQPGRSIQKTFAQKPNITSESSPHPSDRSAFLDPSPDESIYRSVPKSHRPSVVQQHTPPDLDSNSALRQTSPPASQTPRRHIEIYAPHHPLPQRSQSLTYSSPSHTSSHQSSPTYASYHNTPKHSPPEHPSPPTHTPPPRPKEYPLTPVSLHKTSAAPASPFVYEEERPKPIKPEPSYVPVTVRIPDGRRIGFWNRRGDHCTQEGYLVFVPREKAYPPDLANYPEDEYENDFGFRTKFDPKRPELPESLPRRGRSPEIGYDEVGGI